MTFEEKNRAFADAQKRLAEAKKHQRLVDGIINQWGEATRGAELPAVACKKQASREDYMTLDDRYLPKGMERRGFWVLYVNNIADDIARIESEIESLMRSS
jgi:hypothetical protein